MFGRTMITFMAMPLNEFPTLKWFTHSVISFMKSLPALPDGSINRFFLQVVISSYAFLIVVMKSTGKTFLYGNCGSSGTLM